MSRIAFLLLAHKDPAGVVAQARRLTAAGDAVAVHYDANAPRAEAERLRAELAPLPRVAFVERRKRCGWGDWSLVAATIETARTALAAFPEATHFYMLSGDCLPIKTAEYAHALLDREDADFIESFDFYTSGWIRTGFREERLFYRHLVNERRHKRLFYLLYEAQRRLGLTRRPPAELEMMIGSQWWCLRRRTLEKVLRFAETRPDLVRFFRTTWIPDETFFQTLVPHLVPREEIRRRTLTFLMFHDYGMPVTFHDDHEAMLLRQDFLFARKISPEAHGLRAALGALWTATGRSFPITGEGPALHRFLTGRGRVGQRVAPRFWDTSGPRREETIFVVVAKNWALGRALAAAIGEAAGGVPAVGYAFNEIEAGLPDLGGIESSLEKRARHRRAFVRLLLETLGSPRLVLCLDPHSVGTLADLAGARSETRVLVVEEPLDDAFLAGHVARLGLAPEGVGGAELAALVAAVRAELALEVAQLLELRLPNLWRLDRSAGAPAAARVVAAFLNATPEEAAPVVAQLTPLAGAA